VGKLAVTVAVVLLFLLALSASAGAAPVRTASLRIVDLKPLTVAGRSFRPNEKVKLIATSEGVAIRVVRADGRGRFTARLALVSVKCLGTVVQAFGARGSRAYTSLDALDCVP
jgi:hypothetical protein